MTENKRKIRRGLLIGLVAQMVILMIVGGFVYSKYVTKETLEGKLNITADIGTIQLFESEATKQNTGEYTLDKTKPVTSNNYTHVIPGLDIPKDPYVTVTNKTPIPAYIFVEVVADGNFTVSNTHVADKLAYSLTSSWKKLDIAGKNGGTVYAYTTDGTTAKAVTNEDADAIDDISILVEDKIIVSQDVSITLPAELKFYASMGQVVNGKTPAEIYTAQGAA